MEGFKTAIKNYIKNIRKKKRWPISTCILENKRDFEVMPRLQCPGVYNRPKCSSWTQSLARKTRVRLGQL